MTKEKMRRWRLLTDDTLKKIHAEFNDLTLFVVSHVKTVLIFIVLLCTAWLTHKMGNAMLDHDPTMWFAAFLLRTVSNVCLLADVLWLSNKVLPWVPALKRWIDRHSKSD